MKFLSKLFSGRISGNGIFSSDGSDCAGKPAPPMLLRERRLAVIIHSLFSSWMLSFIFEGEVFYSVIGAFDLDPSAMVFGGIAGVFSGLLLSGLFIKTKKGAKKIFLYSYPFFIVISVPFFYSPSALWTAGIVAGSFMAGSCVAAWGYYLKSSTPKNERIKAIADMLILSNVLMILLNMSALYISPHTGLALSMAMLLLALLFALKLPEENYAAPSVYPEQDKGRIGIAPLLVFLCIFIIIITINSGLMYQVINPAFAHLKWLTGWYWAIPYIIAVFTMGHLPQRVNRAYILYVAIAMMGLSFISFMSLSRNVAGYIAVNTLMLGACGVYDLFWWSILGEMLEFHKNPATILGIGLSANVFGILLGGVIGNAIVSVDINSANPVLLALTVVCVALALLPLLHKHLSSLLKDHTYLKAFSEASAQEQLEGPDYEAAFEALSERENQVASRLIQGKTYRIIAGELYISENTVKYYVKNIYSKFNIKSRGELVNIVLEKRMETGK